jgi:hypothetical protein
MLAVGLTSFPGSAWERTVREAPPRRRAGKIDFPHSKENRGNKMKKFRFQYSLRTIFIVSIIFAIVCSIWKCFYDAKREFESVSAIVEKSLRTSEKEVMPPLEKEWKTQFLSNPTRLGDLIFFPNAVTDLAIISEVQRSYFHSHQTWAVTGNFQSPTRNFKSKLRETDFRNMFDFSVRCERSWNSSSGKTSVSIIVYPALENQLILDRLKADLDKAGVAYDIDESASVPRPLPARLRNANRREEDIAEVMQNTSD